MAEQPVEGAADVRLNISKMSIPEINKVPDEW